MLIAIALRGGENTTDHRLLSLELGLLSLHGVSVRRISREETLPTNTDLFVQTAFGASTSLRDAIKKKVPYLIMEAPSFRGFFLDGGAEQASTFTYNGVQAGGTRPRDIPDEERPHPELLQSTGEDTLILGQKPNDHSLRGADHVAWIKEKLIEYPEAEFRHNPIMVPKGYNRPLADALADCGRTISYTSTAAVDSVFAGCETIAEHPASEAYGVYDRELWAHALSWYNFTHSEQTTARVAGWILSGYEEAEANAKAGNVERPRDKVSRPNEDTRYYAEFPYG
jgi:hypothetical protein